jgi:hypothetical protein
VHACLLASACACSEIATAWLDTPFTPPRQRPTAKSVRELEQLPKRVQVLTDRIQKVEAIKSTHRLREVLYYPWFYR